MKTFYVIFRNTEYYAVTVDAKDEDGAEEKALSALQKDMENYYLKDDSILEIDHMVEVE